MHVLFVSFSSDDEDSKDSNEIEKDDSDDDEDVDESLALQRLALMEIILLICKSGKQFFRNWSLHIAMPEEAMVRLCKIFDDEMTDTRMMKSMLDFFWIACTQCEENKVFLLHHSLLDLLELCRKVNKKDEDILSKIDRLVNACNY